MVNIREPLINVVIEDKPKVLKSLRRADRLGPKGKRSGIGAPNSPIVDGEPPAKRRDPSATLRAGSNPRRQGTCAKRGKLIGCPHSESSQELGPEGRSNEEKRAARDAEGPVGRGGRRKRKPCTCQYRTSACL